MGTLKLTPEIAERIRAHAAESYPYECCGALVGRNGAAAREVLDVVRLANRREDSPANRYAIPSDDVRRTEHFAREHKLELLGWYHSHPDAAARPSEYDREQAWPWYSYLIVGVAQGEARDMACWRLRDDRSRFELEPIEPGVVAEGPDVEAFRGG
jgi:proteasome lid subunit RPN8/RPN11